MARFLFVVPPLEGHVNPTVSVAAELRMRGHTVAWVGHPGVVRPLLDPSAELFELDDHISNEFYGERLAEAQRVRSLESFRFVFRDFFLPLARAMVSGVLDSVTKFGPDVIVADQQALAGMIVARQRGIPWATSSTTTAAIIDPFPKLPKVSAWLREQFGALLEDHGLLPPEEPSYDLSPLLVLVFSVRELVGTSRQFPPHIRFVGPAAQFRPHSGEFPWAWLKEGGRILVTLGTVNAERGRGFFALAVKALRDSGRQVILVAPEGLGLDKIDAPNILVRPRVPQLELLKHVQAVVCHAGQNTVTEALYQGLPLVLLPIKDDQAVIAQQVVDAGAGIRLRFNRTSPDDLRSSVERVLSDVSYRQAAQRIREALHDAGGARAAAVFLERLP